MSRFVKIGGVNVNVDKIRKYWIADTPEHFTINVELDNDEILKDICPIMDYIEGCDHIVQVIPCVKPLYARYEVEDGEICESPVYYLGLCAAGYVRPLETCGCEGLMFVDDLDNYLGLHTQTIDKDKNL